MTVTQSYIISKPSSREIIPDYYQTIPPRPQTISGPNVQILSLLKTILRQVTTPSSPLIIWGVSEEIL